MKLSPVFCVLAAAVAVPALAQEAPVLGADEPMRELFKGPGVVAYMTAPRPSAEGRTGAWTWVFLKQAIPAGADNLAMQWEFDCAAGTARTLNTALYNGDAHMQTVAGQTPAAAPTAGSPGAVAMGVACAPPPRGRVMPPLPTRTAARTAATALLAAQP